VFSLRPRAALCLLLLALAGCQQGAQCDLVKLSEVPLELRDRLFTVPATVNGHAINLELDTGGTRSFLLETTVQRLGIARDARRSTAVSGVGGGVPRPVARLESMSIGGTPISVSGISVSTLGGNPAFDGVLGLDFLQHFDLDIDGPHRTLTLYAVRQCEAADPPWNEPFARITGAAAQMGWLTIPLEIDGIQGSAPVDTGASFTMIMPRMMRRLGLTEQTLANDRTVKLHVVATDDVEGRVHRFQTIRIGPMIAHNAAILVFARELPSSGNARNLDGVIGQDFLANRRVWFSFATGRIYVTRKVTDVAGPE
jgi:predicted aspartyl protease